jgi:hypothetical protein
VVAWPAGGCRPVDLGPGATLLRPDGMRRHGAAGSRSSRHSADGWLRDTAADSGVDVPAHAGQLLSLLRSSRTSGGFRPHLPVSVTRPGRADCPDHGRQSRAAEPVRASAEDPQPMAGPTTCSRSIPLAITDQGLLSGHRCRHLRAPRWSFRSQSLGCRGIKLGQTDKGNQRQEPAETYLHEAAGRISRQRREKVRTLAYGGRHVVDDLIPPCASAPQMRWR